ncbi:hypothetical protein EVAR_76773_1 [Eumeta japonica]|uniref:Uncharacterized protein n=1 Tax=Eumeta variegata TaxID=151549 RepID=A0A4C1SWD7_EUMVA|nr:hypothetical protein EVAR_76773_1 [Eumeta japonica]
MVLEGQKIELPGHPPEQAIRKGEAPRISGSAPAGSGNRRTGDRRRGQSKNQSCQARRQRATVTGASVMIGAAKGCATDFEVGGDRRITAQMQSQGGTSRTVGIRCGRERTAARERRIAS